MAQSLLTSPFLLSPFLVGFRSPLEDHTTDGAVREIRERALKGMQWLLVVLAEEVLTPRVVARVTHVLARQPLVRSFDRGFRGKFQRTQNPDPGDRVIVATALLRDLPLLTKDASIHAFPDVTSVW